MDGPPPAAREHFERGVAAFRAGRCDEEPASSEALCAVALESFVSTLEIYPEGLGALRNQAFCERALGRYASAARSFRQLVERAEEVTDPRRQRWAEFAREELARLEPRIPRLRLELSPTVATVELDGQPLATTALAGSLELDPGVHTLTWTSEAGLQRRTLTLEAGQHLVLVVEATHVRTPAAEAPTGRWGPRVLVLVGSSIVAAGLGLGVGAIVERRRACGSDDRCDADVLERGRAYARASNIVTTVGVTTAVVGVVAGRAKRRPERNAWSIGVQPDEHGVQLNLTGAL